MSGPPDPLVHGERRQRRINGQAAVGRNARRPPPVAPLNPNERDPSSRWYRLTADEQAAEEQYMRDALGWRRCVNCGAWYRRVPRCPLCGGGQRIQE